MGQCQSVKSKYAVLEFSPKIQGKLSKSLTRTGNFPALQVQSHPLSSVTFQHLKVLAVWCFKYWKSPGNSCKEVNMSLKILNAQEVCDPLSSRFPEMKYSLLKRILD